MNFADIFKKSFLDGFSGVEITTKYIIGAILFSAVISMYIFLIYRLITRKTFYDKNFNISLVGISVITSAVILTIQSSIVVSLGMVGALSIVRFRTAIKEPLDLVFLFWSISTGIICGAGLAEIAVILALVITIAVFALSKIPFAKAPMLLVVSADNPKVSEQIITTVKVHSACCKIKSRSIKNGTLDMVIEVRTKNDDSSLVNDISKIESVFSVSLLAHDGEVTY